MDREHRALASGLVAAVVVGLALVGLVLVDVLPDRTMGAVVYAWPITAGIVAPQLYLAARGVEPTAARRWIAVLFGTIPLWLVLGSFLDAGAAIGGALAALLLGVCYEVYLRYGRARLASGELRTARED